MKKNNFKKIIKDRYGKIAQTNTSCCNTTQSCCGSVNTTVLSKKIGYSDKELKSIPKDANLGLGCGNPLAYAIIKKGDIVLDLGCGAGLDTFLAAQKVGPKGKVIGVDMTPEMIAKAKANAKKGNYKNVEFRLGEIENLPVIDNSVDVIISNCVINLSLDKKQVFKEAFRVLKPGGRLMVSDIVLEKELPSVIKNSVEAYIGCIAGAMLKNQYLNVIKQAGFRNVKIVEETRFPLDCVINDPNTKTIFRKLNTGKNKKLLNYLLSVKISAVKQSDI